MVVKVASIAVDRPQLLGVVDLEDDFGDLVVSGPGRACVMVSLLIRHLDSHLEPSRGSG